ncbi:MAG: hypothetical protein ACK5KL_19605 [Dysgonomonas sp.]
MYWRDDSSIDIKYTNFHSQDTMHCRLFAIDKNNIKSLPDHWTGKYRTLAYIKAYTRDIVECNYLFDIEKNKTYVSLSSDHKDFNEINKYYAILDPDSVLRLFYAEDCHTSYSIKKKEDKFFVNGIKLDREGYESWISIDKD